MRNGLVSWWRCAREGMTPYHRAVMTTQTTMVAIKAKGKGQKAKVDMAGPHDLSERLLIYGARIVKLVAALPKTTVGRRIGDQLLRSGTSVGANYEESQGAESKADFVHKLQVALKELRESHYWLRLLAASGTVEEHRLQDIINEATQLRAILSKAVATAKTRK
jgi:four helix bundle protein